MRLDKPTEMWLRCALHIYSSGKDGQFCLDKAAECWASAYGDAPVPYDVWLEIFAMTSTDFPGLWVKATRRLKRVCPYL